jgi:hypothetical protein
VELEQGILPALEAELAPFGGRRLHRDLQGQVRVLELWR